MCSHVTLWTEGERKHKVEGMLLLTGGGTTLPVFTTYFEGMAICLFVKDEIGDGKALESWLFL
jgi:hypothetical protein